MCIKHSTLCVGKRGDAELASCSHLLLSLHNFLCGCLGVFFVQCVGFSLIVGSGAYSVLVVVGFSAQQLLIVGTTQLYFRGRVGFMVVAHAEAQAQ